MKDNDRLKAFWRLESAHNLSRNTRNAERWTAEEWLRLYDAYEACDWDFTPCQWTAQQVADALAGLVPQWDSDERPLPSIARR